MSAGGALATAFGNDKSGEITQKLFNEQRYWMSDTGAQERSQVQNRHKQGIGAALTSLGASGTNVKNKKSSGRQYIKSMRHQMNKEVRFLARKQRMDMKLLNLNQELDENARSMQATGDFIDLGIAMFSMGAGAGMSGGGGGATTTTSAGNAQFATNDFSYGKTG